MKGKIGIIILLATIAASLPILPMAASADTLSVELRNGILLSNPDGSNFRILIRFNLPAELDSTEIVFAELVLPVNFEISDSASAALYCNPLLVNSDGDIRWEDLGDTLSWNVIGEGTLYTTTSSGSQVAYFDITDIIKSWQYDALSNKGLILSYDNSLNSLPIFENGFELEGQVKFIYSRIQ